MLELNESNFEKEIKKEKIVVVDFWAGWCQPCLVMSPIIEDLSKEIKNITFAKLNVDGNQDLASRLGVMSIPTFIIFKKGEEVERIIGTNTKHIMKAKIEAVIKS